MSKKAKRKTERPRQTIPAPVKSGHTGKGRVMAMCAALAVMVFAVFGQAAQFQFVNFDDQENVYENPAVMSGLGPRGVVWAFTHSQVGRWTPLVTLSHMLDAQIYGKWAGGHHLTNVLLHAISAALLFLALRMLTRSFWRSGFVAAVFALHPLRAEPVSWVSGRGELLCGMFFMLAIWVYARAVMEKKQRPCGWLMLLIFALGLMSKPMLVTLPALLLILDYWPLRRSAVTSWRPLVMEKIPLFALSSIFSVITVFAQQGVSPPKLDVTFAGRLENVTTAYAIYIGQTLWPVNLAAVYPPHASVGNVMISLLVLLGISAVVFMMRGKQPWLAAGWLWYLGILVPVIGIVQASAETHADRYTYLPQIGLIFALAWMVAAMAEARKAMHAAVAVGIGVIVVCAACSFRQTQYWRDSEALWTHTLDCTTGNSVAYYNFGLDLEQKGRAGDAMANYAKALEINPHYAEAHNNIGLLVARQGKIAEAMEHYRKAVELKPDFAEAHNNIANVYFQSGHVDEAIVEYRKALKSNPGYVESLCNLSTALLQKGGTDEAIALCRKAVGITPGFSEAHCNLGNAYSHAGRVKEAIAQWREALRLNPQSIPSMIDLAWPMATSPDDSIRNGSVAVDLARQANQATGGNDVNALRVLAAAYAEAGLFGEAEESGRRAMELAAARSDTALASQLEKEIKCYSERAPWRSNN